MDYNLTVDSVGEYLIDHGVLSSDATVSSHELAGGVSNAVIRVTTGNRDLVVKQPKPNLAVEDDWPADVDRIHNEAAAARAYVDIIQETNIDQVDIPDVVYENTKDNVIVVTCAPAAMTMWKQQLLEGTVNISIAQVLGEFLGVVHTFSAEDKTLKKTFGNYNHFEQLRLDPYHRTIAKQYPQLEATIREEINRLRSTKRTLVHGDFSPKNVLVKSNSKNRSIAWVLDFEVTHWGDPAFDTGFMLNHLLIKSVKNNELGDQYIKAARSFWQEYRSVTEWNIETETTRELAILMLARIDGTSPVKYIEDQKKKDLLRSTAKEALESGVTTLDQYIKILNNNQTS